MVVRSYRWWGWLAIFLWGQVYAEQVTMRIVTELSPPHQTLEKGEVAGLSTELVKAVLQQANLDSQIEIYPWARSFRIARQQPNVLIYNIARTPEREQQFHWIGHIASYQLGFVKLSERTDIHIHGVSDAARFTVAVQRDDLSADYLKQKWPDKESQLVLTADINESWRLLLKGKVDLVIDDAIALRSMTEQLQIPLTHVKYSYAIPALQQRTWLAASIQTPSHIVERLRQAHARVAATARYQQIMQSEY